MSFYQLTVCIYRFTSGKLVITGSKSSSEALLSAYHVSRLLRRVCVGQKFNVVDYQIQNIVRCYSIIYEFIPAKGVYLQVGNAELDVKEGQILDIEGAPKLWLLGYYSRIWFFLTVLLFRPLQSLPHLFYIPASYFCECVFFDVFCNTLY